MVLLEEMRPLEIQDATARNVPLLLPVGVLENHGYHNPCGLDLLCCRGTCELVAERIEAVVAPPLSYGPGVDAVGSPEMGSLELGYKEFLPHAQAVVEGLIKMGFYNIFCVCHHQGEGGQQALCMKLVAANLGLGVPNEAHPHWWGELSPDDDRPRSPSIQVLAAQAGRTLEKEYQHVGHGNTARHNAHTNTVDKNESSETEGSPICAPPPLLCDDCARETHRSFSAVYRCGAACGGVIIAGNFYETAAIMGLYPHAVDLTELTSGRRSEAETPWFGKHKYADGADINAGLSAKDATEEFGATRAHALFLRVALCLPEPVLTKSPCILETG
jgi:creatinine amidohydrolase/Fe(II)-dependent formamide hydrolase-like protein